MNNLKKAIAVVAFAVPVLTGCEEDPSVALGLADLSSTPPESADIATMTSASTADAPPTTADPIITPSGDVLFPAADEMGILYSPNFNITNTTTWSATFSYELSLADAAPGPVTQGNLELVVLSILPPAVGSPIPTFYIASGAVNEVDTEQSEVSASTGVFGCISFGYESGSSFTLPTYPGKHWVWLDYANSDDEGELTTLKMYVSDSETKPETPDVDISLDVYTINLEDLEIDFPTDLVDPVLAVTHLVLGYENADVSTDLTVFSDFEFVAAPASLTPAP